MEPKRPDFGPGFRNPLIRVETCQCKANLKGRWIEGNYICIRCGKPVYEFPLK